MKINELYIINFVNYEFEYEYVIPILKRDYYVENVKKEILKKCYSKRIKDISAHFDINNVVFHFYLSKNLFIVFSGDLGSFYPELFAKKISNFWFENYNLISSSIAKKSLENKLSQFIIEIESQIENIQSTNDFMNTFHKLDSKVIERGDELSLLSAQVSLLANLSSAFNKKLEDKNYNAIFYAVCIITFVCIFILMFV